MQFNTSYAYLVIIENIREGVSQKSWKRSGHNNYSDKYSLLSQINKLNVSKLKVAWSYHSREDGSVQSIQTSPIFSETEGMLFTSSACCLLGVNARNGLEEWRLKLPGPVARRGLTYGNGYLYVPTSKGVFAVVAKTGKIYKNMGSEGVFGKEFSVLPPVLDESQLIVADFANTISSWNVVSGKKLWTTSLAKGDVFPRLWSGLSYDDKNKLVFVVTSNSMGLIEHAAHDNYASSILCIDGKNGKILWQFQELKNERWDLDMVGAPNLFDMVLDDKTIPVLVAVSKTGNTILLNRLTGKSIFGFENRVAPRSTIDGEVTADRQIFITKPSPFSSLNFDKLNDVTDITEEKKSYVLHKLRNSKSDWLMPVSLSYDVVMFGLNGGAEWPGSAVDPKNATLVVPANRIPFIIRAAYTDRSPEKTKAIAAKNHIYFNKCSACHDEKLNGIINTEGSDLFNPSLIGITKKRTKEFLTSLDTFKINHKYAGMRNSGKMNAPLKSVSSHELSSTFELFKEVDTDITKRNDFGVDATWQTLLDPDGLFGSKPPWGYVVAIDLKTGLIKWKVPTGQVYDPVTKKMYLGDFQFGGVAITNGGVVFTTGTRDKKASALDVDNGSLLWETELPASGSSPPITYQIDGCQYVAFTATGGGAFW